MLARAPDLADDKKISMVSRLVTDIDEVPTRYKAIQASGSISTEANSAGQFPLIPLRKCCSSTQASAPVLMSYAVLQALYLSKNYLQSLRGVGQFHKLMKLSAADNQLMGFQVLTALGALAGTLQAANFEGNPMAALPNYRAHVCPLPSFTQTDAARTELFKFCETSWRW